MFVGYNVNRHFGLQFNLPVIYRAYGSDGGGDHAEGGIGNASLLGNLLLSEKLEENFTFTLRALGGVKFPTGDSNRLRSK